MNEIIDTPTPSIYAAYPEFKDVLSGILERVGSLDNLSDEQLKRLWDKKAELARIRRDDPVSFYVPYESRLRRGWRPQEDFHRSDARVRMIGGGNRSGKTEAGSVEDVWWLTGRHPYLKVPKVCKGWIVSLDFGTSFNISEPKFRKWLPPSVVKKWDNEKRQVTLVNGSQVTFKSCDQDLPKFGGDDLDWIHFDEEPPGVRGFEIFKECKMRLIDRKGKMWFTLTPVSGFSWSHDEIFAKGGVDPNVHVTQIDTRENPYLDEKYLEDLRRDMSHDEEEMRLKGNYVHFSGLVYKEFNRAIHVIPPIVDLSRDFPRYRGIDHGLRAPTACLWAAVTNHDEVIIYDEYYETGKTIKENCESIKQLTAGDRIIWTMIDPATRQRAAQTGVSDLEEYRKHGIVARALQHDKMAGINLIKQLLTVDEKTKRPRLFIYNTCHNLIKEISRYRWRQHRGIDVNDREEVVKVDDHALDALRYLLASRPRYKLEEDEEVQTEEPWY